MSPRDHTPSGRGRVDVVVELLDRVDRHIADPHTVAVAQVHATLAVADALADIHAALADLEVRAVSRRPVNHPTE